MQSSEVDEFLRRFAPGDVRDTIAWLSANGYALESHRGEGSFGARFVYAGPAKVIITVDRSQWMLDVAPQPDTEPWQYDLLVAAYAGRAYGEVFPEESPLAPGGRDADQLPDGVSWRASLPAILAWVATNGVQRLVDRARRERSKLMQFGRPPG